MTWTQHTLSYFLSCSDMRFRVLGTHCRPTHSFFFQSFSSQHYKLYYS